MASYNFEMYNPALTYDDIKISRYISLLLLISLKAPKTGASRVYGCKKVVEKNHADFYSPQK